SAFCSPGSAIAPTASCRGWSYTGSSTGRPSPSSSCASRLVVLVAVLDDELVGRDVLEEAAELQHLRLELLLVDLLALELDRRLGDHVVGREDRRLGADRERDRVGRARVDLDLLAVLDDGDLRVERVLAQLRDGDATDRRTELLEHFADEIVRHRAN